jgi:hypothetical protein
MVDPPPPFVDDLLRQYSIAATARVMLLDAELARIAAGLASAGVPVIVLKGPALARTIYSRRELRPYGDLDLTVRKEDEAAAVRVLEHFGLREMSFAAEAARLAHANHVHEGSAYHRQFTDATGEVFVELHADPLQLGVRPTCEAGRWRRALPLPEVPGALMLAPEDQLVQLSVHAHKHGFERLIWIKDIDLLLRAYGDRLHWRTVRSVAWREGVTPSVWYTLTLARRLLATPVPRAVTEGLAPSWPVRTLYSLIWPASRVAELEGFMRRRAVQFHAAESWRGMLPSLILMNRRRARLRAIVQYFARRSATRAG